MLGPQTVNMPYKYRRSCPVCHKPDLQFLSDHLRQVHNLYGSERKQLLSMALFSQQKYYTHNPLRSASSNVNSSRPSISRNIQNGKKRALKSPKPISSKRKKEDICLVTEPYLDFKFRHKFSLLVVGPTQSGKTHFVQQILEKDWILYGTSKKRRILWYYTQWQNGYQIMKGMFNKEISFHQGLPNFTEDLREIDSSFNNLIILDDLMAEAIDSTIVSRLFTQGRHRNASVILLLQNMFPKGKYNTDISRNAQYIALFRSPSDRKQIGIVAERMFDKQRNRFMEAFYRETQKPFGYLLVDNKPDTPVDKQVIGDIFGQCHVFSSINKANEESERAKSSADVIQSRAPSVFWSDAVIHVWQNYTNDVKYVKSIPQGYTIVEMYKTSRNPHHPNQPGVSLGGELYWPVKIRNLCNGSFKWVNLHEDDPIVKIIVQEALAGEMIS
ncbi:uncharacterized protein LOC110245632 [Exaiptasia diaphana]|uniref:Uncharacterized protein n=1 Tax=Exaiptasia diaphana TaxID=2652724 RepID=A0A913XPG2_EXADI|nr:uncharacterized protein LOC110245632 [Exaiptasia diaphana]